MVYTTPKLSFMTGLITPNQLSHEPYPNEYKPEFKRDFERYINARYLALNNLKKLQKKIQDFQIKPQVHRILEPLEVENSIENPEYAAS